MDAGVSVGTVSNVINGGNVSEERRQRVEQSIQKLGYQVNGIARKMRTQRTDYVVVILPDITNPFYSLLLQGLETLSLRVERHVENALRVVDFLVNHPKVERVNHPSLPENGYRPLYEKYFPRGGGSIFTFEIKGGAAEAQAFIDKLRIFSLLANVADVKSLAIHPASTTHSQMTPEELAQSGIRPNTIRLSIGTEHIDDILADLAAALEA